MSAPNAVEPGMQAPQLERTYPIAYVKNKTSPVYQHQRIKWEELIADLGKCVLGEKDGQGWLPADVPLGPRNQSRVKGVSLLVLDIEADAHAAKDESGKPLLDHNGDIIKVVTGKEPPAFDEMIAELDLWDWRYLLHTSYSHCAEHSRFRIVLDLSRSLVQSKNEHEMRTLAVHVAGMLGLSYCMDTSCLESARLFYTPRAPADRLALFRSVTGGDNPLDVSKLLAEAEGIEQARKYIPVSKPGKTGTVIGTFNDNHDAGAIVDAHPDRYEFKGPGRWLYCESTTGMPGVRLLPEKDGKSTIYSSHSGDPLSNGHAHDAFSVYCILDHGGDVSKAVKAAARILGMDGHNAPGVDFDSRAADFPPEYEAEATSADPEPALGYPAPFRGVMAETVTAALSVAVKQQPDLCTLAALLGMAGACDGVFALPSGMRLNLYGCGVAGTGEGKDAPRSVAIALTKAADGNLIGRPASGPGLEDALPDSGASLMALDEIAHFFAAVNGDNAPPHLIELAGTLLQLFSAGKGDYYTRTRATAKGTTPARILKNPVVSLLGFSTPEKLGEAMGVSNIEDGLLGRFLFAFGQSGEPPRRTTGRFSLPSFAQNAAAAVKSGIAVADFFVVQNDDGGSTVQGNADRLIHIKITDEAEIRLGELLVKFDRQRLDVKTAFGKALLTRSAEKCERVAGVIAVWDNPCSPVITLEHVTWAESLLLASDSALIRFSVEFMHGGKVQSNAAKVLALIKRARNGELKPQKKHEPPLVSIGLAPRSMVLRASKLNKKEFDDAIEYLDALGDIEDSTIEKSHPNGRKEFMHGLVLKR